MWCWSPCDVGPSAQAQGPERREMIAALRPLLERCPCGMIRAVLPRFALLAPALAGVLLLVISQFSTLLEIKVITAVVEERSPFDQHGPSLLIIAIFSAVMAFGAVVGRSTPAAVALLALALVAVAITLLVDLPKLDETGLYGERYEAAQSRAGTGFYMETLGAAVLLLSAVAMLVFRPTARIEEKDGAPRRTAEH